MLKKITKFFSTNTNLKAEVPEFKYNLTHTKSTSALTEILELNGTSVYKFLNSFMSGHLTVFSILFQVNFEKQFVRLFTMKRMCPNDKGIFFFLFMP